MKEGDEIPGKSTTFTSPAQSPSSSGSRESCSNGRAGVQTPASKNSFINLNQLYVHKDDAASPQEVIVNTKKRRMHRPTGGDKNGRGLRQFSLKVCEKVESKGRTTYNEVADELVAEFSDPNSNLTSSDQQYEEKNIRRRVYDALNVLMAMDIILKNKKEIIWKGLPRMGLQDLEKLKADQMRLRTKVQQKRAYLIELQEQYAGLLNLATRNKQVWSSRRSTSRGVYLPFILVHTRPDATVVVEIAEDKKTVRIDFDSTPFQIHDDSYVVQAMKHYLRQNHDDTHDTAVDGGTHENLSALEMYRRYTMQSRMPNKVGNMSSSP